MRVATIGLAVALAFGAGMAQAQECENAETQAELTGCAAKAWQVADAELNEAYAAAMGWAKGMDADLPKADRGAATTLRDAQRKWIAFRDAACAAEGWAFKGGSPEQMVVFGCMEFLTAQRSEQLWALSNEGPGG